jgi:hypothetical protein
MEEARKFTREVGKKRAREGRAGAGAGAGARANILGRAGERLTSSDRFLTGEHLGSADEWGRRR